MSAEISHHWRVPPREGCTVEDLLTLPDLPPHTELIDGSLVFVRPQRCSTSTSRTSTASEPGRHGGATRPSLTPPQA